MQTPILVYLDILFKILAISLSTIAIFQLVEVKRKRHLDTYWKIYEVYTSDVQKIARKDTIFLRSLIQKHVISGLNQAEIIESYSLKYHLTDNDDEKKIDRSIINRIRFLNLTGSLLKMKLINKDMLFELIGIGFEHDYSTMKVVVEAHRKDHNAPNMYGYFENVQYHYEKWKRL